MIQQQVENRQAPPRPKGKQPKWMTEDYSGMETDIADDIYAAIYWKLYDEAEKKAQAANKEFEPTKDLAIQAQLITDAIDKAATQANRVQSGAERASHQLIQIINEMGLFRMVREEFDSIEQWLSDRIPELPAQSAGLYNATYLHKTFLPLIREYGNGLSAKPLLELKENWSKNASRSSFYASMLKGIDRYGCRLSSIH
jgi:hypothetical protein